MRKVLSELQCMLLCLSMTIPSASGAPWTEYRITTSPAHQQTPDIDVYTVAWRDHRHSTSEIYAADISDPNNPMEFVISNESLKEGPRIAGSFVFSLRSESDCVSGSEKRNIYGHNLDTQTTFKVTDYECPSATINFSLGGNDGETMVWIHDGWIKGYDISTDSLFHISYMYAAVEEAWFLSADVSDNIVVWTDYRNDNFNIYGFDMSTWQDFPITTNPEWKFCPAISQNIVVWQDYRNGYPDIYGADIIDPYNPVEFPICTDASSQLYPAICGNIIVWEDYRNGNVDIYGYDISTQTEFQITDNTSDQVRPAISGHTVVWQDMRHGHGDIYATILYGPIVPRCTSPVQGDINGDCKVNFVDFALMLNNWLDCNLDPPEACWE